jgi:SAM-dependent methyltransferase
MINSYLDHWDKIFLDMKPETPLLDLGCGPGRLLGKLIENCYYDVFGIDISQNGLILARNRGKHETKIPGFALGLLEYIPYRTGSFKTAILSGVYHHLEQPKIVLSEIARILQDHGKLIIADPYFPPPVRQLINVVLDIYPITGDRRFYSPGKIEKLAERFGLIKKDMVNMSMSYILVFEKCCN